MVRARQSRGVVERVEPDRGEVLDTASGGPLIWRPPLDRVELVAGSPSLTPRAPGAAGAGGDYSVNWNSTRLVSVTRVEVSS
jgi:hypothetical protein